MSQYHDRTHNVRGDVTITHRNKETGEIVDQYEKNNLFVDLGYRALFRAVTTENSEDYVVKELRFGSDFEESDAPANTYDIFNPQPAQADTDSNTQTLVFTITRPALAVNYPAFDQVTFSTVLDGSNILSQFPGNVDVRYNSLGLYVDVGDPIAYLRFPIKSINALISVDILWQLTFVSA